MACEDLKQAWEEAKNRLQDARQNLEKETGSSIPSDNVGSSNPMVQAQINKLQKEIKDAAYRLGKARIAYKKCMKEDTYPL